MEKLELIPFADERALVHAAACAWLEEIAAQSGGGKPYCVALSGGRVANAFFPAVAAAARAGEGQLRSVHFFWSDERCVPPGDPESNFRIAQELLFVPLKIANERIHRLRGEAPVEFAVLEGEAELCRIAPLNREGQPVLDLVLLGLGEDGHIASLFPDETEGVMASQAVYRAVVARKPPPRRITLGYAAIAVAKQVWVLASGAGKESALHESLRPEGRTPLARLLRNRQNTKIFTAIPLG